MEVRVSADSSALLISLLFLHSLFDLDEHPVYTLRVCGRVSLVRLRSAGHSLCRWRLGMARHSSMPCPNMSSVRSRRDYDGRLAITLD